MKLNLVHALLFLHLICFGPLGYATTITPIKIGAIYNLTGSQQVLDIPSWHGAELAVQKINEAGGILGRPLQLVTVDGKTDPAVITKAAEQFAKDKDIVAVIGLNDTGMAQAAIPPIVKAKKIFMITGATGPELATIAPRYVYLACFTDDKQAKVAAKFMIKKLKADTAALLIQKNMEYTEQLGKYLRQYYLELQGTFLIQNTFIQNHFALDPLPILSKKPQGIFLAAASEVAKQEIQQIRGAFLMQPIIGGDGFDFDGIETAGSDIYFTTHALLTLSNNNILVQHFITAYKTRFHHLPENSFAGLGYDSLQLIAKAIQAGGRTHTDAIRHALDHLYYEGVTGKISYQHGKSVPIKPITVVHIKNGQRLFAGQFLPT